MSGNKLFIGNLSFKIREADLIDAFKKCGKVVDAKVVRKMNGLSRGFGFVEYEKEEDALKAVKELDKLEIFERPINVLLSTSTGEKTSDSNTSPTERRSTNFEKRSPNFEKRSSNQRTPPSDRRNDNRRPGSNPPFRSNYSNRKTYTLTRGDSDNNYRRDGRRDFRRDGRRDFRRDGRNQNRPQQGRGNRTNNGYNKVAEKKPNENENNNIQKTESKTTIFVANLPYAYIDENLVELFKECGGIKTAHVVRNEKRSRGYGFVEFEDKEGQENAIKKMNDFPVKNSNGEDRNLIVKVAVNIED